MKEMMMNLRKIDERIKQSKVVTVIIGLMLSALVAYAYVPILEWMTEMTVFTPIADIIPLFTTKIMQFIVFVEMFICIMMD